MNEKGFTLVETLVSLVAGSFLLGSISWVIAGVGDDLRSMEQSQDGLKASQAADLLNDILSDARFLDVNSAALPRSSSELKFRTPAPLALGRSGYLGAQLIVVGNRDDRTLVLQWPEGNLPETILLSAKQDIELRYTATSDSNGPQFLKKIEISIEDREERDPQIISVRPRINAVGACIFDPISQQCRT